MSTKPNIDAVADGLRELGFDVGIKLAYDWAFYVEDGTPPGVEDGLRMAEAAAWSNGHPREVVGSLVLPMPSGKRYVIEALGYEPKALDDVQFWGFAPGADVPDDMTLAAVRHTTAMFPTAPKDTP